MNYEKIVELDNVTLQDCCEMYDYRNMVTIIEDGRIVNFIKQDK